MESPNCKPLVLGIETSCDEAAASVYDGISHKIHSHIVASQIDVHRMYGGVVPEIASREHLKTLPLVIDKALKQASICISQIGAVAVTNRPGLIGSLLIGLSYAKGLAYQLDIPFVGVDHIEAHSMAAHLEHHINYPYIALVVSGGHTQLYYVESLGEFQLMGKTLDDAAGEAFDKVAKFLKLGFPGGPIIDQLSREGNRQAINFPKSFINEDHFQFSFSGLKTAVTRYVQCHGESNLADVVASFQEAIVDVLLAKTVRLSLQKKCPRVVLGGGVACNSRLREKMTQECTKKDIQLFIPSPLLCSDNAAMIAYTGWQYLKRGKSDSFDLNAVPVLAPDSYL
ncbi:MAG: tRNA (adenosine(37)-N6)-threonylcarbamoyltransferase complex transferase subunit TsaD [Deltaproteobacteria bacterium]|nr:tRNA (adenosine(37)-N6)-threonylcarbamoyltransferase complex transferase subunit TsaD [Deltaproteobacteria bacterium]